MPAHQGGISFDFNWDNRSSSCGEMSVLFEATILPGLYGYESAWM
jgi:hypothetical protein